MAAVLLVAKGSRRPSDSLPALGFAIAAVVIGDPFQARDAGFALSVLATAGLLLFAPRIVDWLSKYLPALMSQALALPIAATVFGHVDRHSRFGRSFGCHNSELWFGGSGHRVHQQKNAGATMMLAIQHVRPS